MPGRAKRKTAHPDAGPVLVTGATGFLGGHLVRDLIASGVPVRATGRNLRIGLALRAIGADFRPVDLTDRAATVAACAGVSAVVHAGALSSAWGTREAFYAANVRGTQHVVEGCLLHGVPRLVHISSPSVMSRFAPQLGITESDPLPEKFVSLYAETKKIAEDRVRAGHACGLATVILRPKAIYGPGDNAIFPRILRSAERGRLARIGDGSAVTNLTHVADVVSAIRLALESPDAAGKTFLITGGDDVRIWDVILDLLARLGLPAPTRNISPAKAMAIAGILEATWRAAKLPGEPPLTRYAAGILVYSQTYDITAARTVLGYEPRVKLAEGIADFVKSLEPSTRAQHAAPLRSNVLSSTVGAPSGRDFNPAENRDRAEDGAPTVLTENVRHSRESGNPGPLGPRLRGDDGNTQRVAVEVLNAGVCRVKEATFLPGGSWRTIDVPALFALIRHPRAGVVLFDTGYSPRFHEATRAFPNRVYRWLTPVRVTDEETAAARLRARGIDPAAVRLVVLSHFDPDHYGGLLDFPNARIACSWRAWESVAGKHGLEALKMRVLPGHLPYDLAARIEVLPDPDGPAVGPFDASLDLFGDGAVRLVALPGHAPGQMGALLALDDGTAMFLAADGCWSRANVDGETIRGGVHRVMAHDKPGQDDTYRRLRRLIREHPDVQVVPAHCPKAAADVLAR